MPEDEPAWWRDYVAHVLLLVATAALFGLRVSGLTDWPWWLALVPLVVLFLIWVGTHGVLRFHHGHQDA